MKNSLKKKIALLPTITILLFVLLSGCFSEKKVFTGNQGAIILNPDNNEFVFDVNRYTETGFYPEKKSSSAVFTFNTVSFLSKNLKPLNVLFLLITTPFNNQIVVGEKAYIVEINKQKKILYIYDEFMENILLQARFEPEKVSEKTVSLYLNDENTAVLYNFMVRQNMESVVFFLSSQVLKANEGNKIVFQGTKIVDNQIGYYFPSSISKIKGESSFLFKDSMGNKIKVLIDTETGMPLTSQKKIKIKKNNESVLLKSGSTKISPQITAVNRNGSLAIIKQVG